MAFARRSGAFGNAAQDSGEENEKQSIQKQRNRQPFLPFQTQILDHYLHRSASQRAISGPDKFNAFEASVERAKDKRGGTNQGSPNRSEERRVGKECRS